MMAAEPIPIIAEERGPYATRSTDSSEPRPLARVSALPAMTGAANAVNDALWKLNIQPTATRVLRYLESQTFSRAGFHEQWGHEAPGTWCWFDLTDWARALKISRSALIHQRGRLTRQRFIWYEPDPNTPGRGRIGWNLNIASWHPFQPDEPQWGGKRQGAGHPKTTTPASPVTQPSVDNSNIQQSNVDNLKDSAQPSIDNLIAMQGDVDNLKDSDLFKLSRVARFGAGPRLGWLDSIRKDTLRRDPDIQIESNDSTADAVDTAPLGGATGQADATEMPSAADVLPVPPIEGDPSCSQGIYEIAARLQDAGRTPTPYSARPPTPRSPVACAAAAGAVPVAPPNRVSAGKPTKTRTRSEEDKLQPGEREYRAALLTAIETVLGGEKPPNHQQEWRGARWFFREAPDHPAPVERVAECYCAEMRRPRWDGQYLSLIELRKVYGPFNRNPSGHRAAVQRAIAAKDGAYDRTAQQATAAGRREGSGREYVQPRPQPMRIMGDSPIEGETDEEYTARTGKVWQGPPLPLM